MTHTEPSARARIFVEQAYGAEIEKVAKEFRRKASELGAQFALHGTVLSGTMTSALARMNGEMITALVTKRLEFWIESCGMYEFTITDEVARDILDDVLTVRRNLLHNAASTGASVGGQVLPGGSGASYLALLEQHVSVNLASIRTEVERHRFAPRTPARTATHVTHHNEIHVHGSTIGNLNLGSQIGTINTALQQISESNPALVEALKTLTEAVAQSNALSDESKQESIQALAELAKQAQAKPEERSTITVKALLELLPIALKAAPDLVRIAKNYWPLIKAHFGVYPQ